MQVATSGGCSTLRYDALSVDGLGCEGSHLSGCGSAGLVLIRSLLRVANGDSGVPVESLADRKGLLATAAPGAARGAGHKC